MSMEVLKSSKIYKQIECDIEDYVKEILAGYEPQSTRNKTIRDSVWGSVEYMAWEIQLIDSPFFQRLRYIHQVGLAFLTYPASQHTRFEHSLGVNAAAKKMCEKLSKKDNSFYQLRDTDKNKIYLAAILHDIGHCFYSHLSESIYGEFDDFKQLIRTFNQELERKPKPHEIMAFIIINTNSFKQFFRRYIGYPGEKTDTLFEDVGRIIIGAYIVEENNILSFITSIINGPFDADKLDYIKRDSLTTGLSLSYDVERLLTKILIYGERGSGGRIEQKLVVQFNGITALEELTFCKIMLFSYIYYHQKVLTADIMVKDYVYGLKNLKILNTYSDFLRQTDSSILDLASLQNNIQPFPEYANLDLSKLSNRIKNRLLPKRCFELSRSNVESVDEEKIDSENIKKLCDGLKQKCSDSDITREDLLDEASILTAKILHKEVVSLDPLIYDYVRTDISYLDMLDKRQEFCSLLTKKYKEQERPIRFNLFDIYLAFPKEVSFGVSSDKIVLGKDKSTLLAINDFMKLDDWAASFNSNKWRAYVFVCDNAIDINIAFAVAEKMILQDKAKLKFPEAYLAGVAAD